MAKTKGKARGLQPDEIKVHGLQACLQLFHVRPQDVVRLYLTEARARQHGEMMKWCAANRRAYHVVTEGELDVIAGTVHHEGMAFVAKALPPVAWEAFSRWAAGAAGPVLLLDGVQNPQNVGAILRVAAHFGVPYLLGSPDTVRLTPSALRVAEGAAEWVRLVPWEGAERLTALKEAGFTRIATSSHKGQSLYRYRFPPKTAFILGSEAKGVSRETFAAADQVVTIPGTGRMESLNVATATALLLGEYARQHRKFT